MDKTKGKFQKFVLLIFPFLILGLLFAGNIPQAKALTREEILAQLKAIQEQLNQIAKQLPQVQKEAPSLAILSTPVLVSPINSQTVDSLTPFLKWKEVKGATIYQWVVNEKGAGYRTASGEVKAPSTEVRVPAGKLTYEKTYQWWVRAGDGSQWSKWSYDFFRTPEKKILPPTKLSPPYLILPEKGSTISYLTPVLDWSEVSGAEVYQWVIAEAGKRIAEGIETISYVALTSGKLEYNKTYSWWVRACTDRSLINCSDWSDEWTFKTKKEEFLLSPPTIVLPKGGITVTSLTPILDWEEVSGARVYEWVVGTKTSTIERKTVEAPVTSAAVSSGKLDYDTTYYWWVRACKYTNLTECSSWSEESFKTPKKEVLPAPTIISPKDGEIVTSLTPTLKWETVSGAKTYEWVVGTKTLALERNTTTSPSATVSPGKLDYDTTYYWWVKAGRDTEESRWSEAAFKTPKKEAVPTAQPSITITSPISGQTLTAKSSFTVKWTSQNLTTGKIQVHYCLKAFKDCLDKDWVTLTSDLPLTATSYSWTIPDYQGKATFGVGNWTPGQWIIKTQVEISIILAPTGPLTLIFPNGGECLVRGNTYNIRWQMALISNVDIILYKGGEIVWAKSNAPCSSQECTFSWKIPDDLELGKDYKIEIRSLILGYSDLSDKYFSIQSREPCFDISYPDGGELFQRGETYEIRWSSSGSTRARINLVREWKSNIDYRTVTGIVSEVSSPLGKYSWKVPYDLELRNDYRIEIYDLVNYKLPHYGFDFSDANFSIVRETIPPAVLSTPILISPIGETVDTLTPVLKWGRVTGAKVYEWVVAELGATVRAAEGKITALLPEPSTYSVAVPAGKLIADRTYKWWVRACADTTCSSWSESWFKTKAEAILPPTAQPSITITSPTSGQTLTAKSPFTIGWSSQNLTSGKIHLLYCLREFANCQSADWKAISREISLTATSFSWTVPDYQGKATLWVGNWDGKWVAPDKVEFSITKVPTITDAKPTVGLVAPLSAYVGDTVSLTVTGQDDKDVLALYLDPGTGYFDKIYTCSGTQTTCSQTFTHTFTTAGTYTLRAEARDSALQDSTTATKQITIYDIGP